MKVVCVVLLFANFLNCCASLEHVWHSYQYDPNHQNREELIITNITADDQFKLNYNVKRWKSLCVEKFCYLAGLLDKNVIISSTSLNSSRNGFFQKSQMIDLGEKPDDVALFEYWNSTLENSEIIVVTAIQKNLLWFKINDDDISLFWSWPIDKNIGHINIFQIGYDYHLLIINQHLSKTTADVYQFELKGSPNFWLRQKVDLSDFAQSSTVITRGPDYFLAIPQSSLDSLLIYKLNNDHFIPYENLTSKDITNVVSFNAGHKSFLAIDGTNAGIYHINKKLFIRENLTNSHFTGVNFWLPIHLSVYGDDIMLIAQRSLHHGGHKSLAVVVITYNGDKFEEHEDITCLYYGEKSLGLSCLPDEGGIEGSVVIHIDNVLGLLIPRNNRNSDLFLVKTSVKKIPNPLNQQINDFIKRKEEINNLIDAQEKKYKEFVANPPQLLSFESIKKQLDEMEENIEAMKEQMNSTDSSHYNTVTFNGPVEIKGNLIAEEVEVEKIADTVLEDIVLKNNIGAIVAPKTFKNLTVEDLLFKKVNGIDSNQLMFSTDNITIDGNVLLENPLVVSQDVKASKVNGLEFENEIINLESPVEEELILENVEVFKTASVQKLNSHHVSPAAWDGENLEVESLFLPFNITVVNINNESFDIFLNQLCLKNIKNYIPGVITVNGDVTVKENVRTDYFNDLKFPQEYVFSDNTFPNITGVKRFNKLSTLEVNCEGTIDGINTSQLITLSTDQKIPKTTTFQKLKNTESLNVDGNITGEHASKFLPNPTLLETNLVTSKVHFKDLEVEGCIILSDNLNGKNFESLLSDIVYTTEEQPVIEGLKHLPEGLTVRKNLIISSNSINSININTIVTKNGDQSLDLGVIDGIVTFDNVEIDGLYDNVDIKKLDEELVKLDGEQYISSTLIFEDELVVNELEAQTIRFDVVDVENLVVEGNIYGNLEGFNLEEFDKHRMSLTQKQTIENMTIEKSFMKNFSPETINQINSNEFTSNVTQKKLKQRILNGNLEIKALHVNGSLTIDRIQNKSFIGLGGSFWKHGDKKNLTNLIFNDDVHFNSVQIEKFGGVNFDKYLNNIVFKNETDVTFKDRKTFLKGFTVRKLIETQRLNNVALGNTLTRHGEQEVFSPVTIQGNVSFANITADEINNVATRLITGLFYTSDGKVHLNGDIIFNRLPHIHNLCIKGFVGDHLVQEFLDNIVYTDGNFKLQGQTSFQNNVNIEKNMRVIGKINNIDLPAFVSDMVMITKDATIKSIVKFAEPTFIEDEMVINEEFKTHSLNGINPSLWVDNAIFVNKGFLKGKYLFENARIVDNLQTKYINDINLETLVPLRTQQDLTELSFNEITLFKDLPVGNSTNFHNLPNEFANTVLINSDEDIYSDVEFHGNVFIENDVEISGLLNEMDLNHIVTTNTNQELTAIYNFKSKVNIGKNMIVEGLVNGINISEWSLEAVKTSSLLTQNITDNWVIDQDLVFEEDTMGHGLINGLNFELFSHDVEKKRSYRYELEKALIDDYTNICKDLTYMYDKLQNQIYKFNYLENLQMLNFQNKIQHVYYYKHQNNVYLLINEENNCESHLFTFDKEFNFFKRLHFGHIAQVISVHYNNLMYLVIRNQPFYSTCKVQGTNLWQVNDNDFVHVANFEDQDLLQESLVAGTFYGLSRAGVTEFKVLPDLDVVTRYRKWEVEEENVAFIPRGLATGLALRTGRKLIRLHREDPIIEDFSYNTEKIIRGNCTEEINSYLPGRKGSDLVVMKVGIKSSKRSLLAVASHEETSVKGSLDFIRIYEDVLNGKMFHKVATYKPSSLISLEFNNGETFLAFMEDESFLQVYEYKGIEGFKHRLSSKLEGSKLLSIELPDESKIIGVIDKNKISFIKAVMSGNQIERDLHCFL